LIRVHACAQIEDLNQGDGLDDGAQQNPIEEGQYQLERLNSARWFRAPLLNHGPVMGMDLKANTAL
jgi:hypothetical protein